jgi:hypothetical protein
MSRKLKVFGVESFVWGKQVRIVAATTSQKRFAEITRSSQRHIRLYAAETKNPEELKIAMGKPETVFARCPVCEEWKEIG